MATRMRGVSVTGLWALAVYGVYTYLGPGLRATAHFSAALVAAGLAIYGVGAITGNLIGGRLADRRGAPLVSTVSLIALAAVDAVLGFVLGIRPALLVGLGLIAFAAYPYFSAHQNRLVNAFPDQAGSTGVEQHRHVPRDRRLARGRPHPGRRRLPDTRRVRRRRRSPRHPLGHHTPTSNNDMKLCRCQQCSRQPESQRRSTLGFCGKIASCGLR